VSSVGDDIDYRFYFFDLDGALVSGLTVNVTVRDEGGNVIVPSGSALAFGEGYRYVLSGALVDAPGLYEAKATPTVTTDLVNAYALAAAEVTSGVAVDVWNYAPRTLSADPTGVTTLLSRIASALTITSGKVDANTVEINGSSSAAAQLARSAATIVNAEAAAGTLTTTQMTTTLTETTSEHYKGRIILWTTGALAQQATDIIAYDGATKTLTYTAVTEAPTAGDTFIIV
jgi:hypothetical protein